MATGKTTKRVNPSHPFRAVDHLKSEAEIAAYIEAMLEDGDARAAPIALRTVADAVGGACSEDEAFPRDALSRTVPQRKSAPRYAGGDFGGVRVAIVGAAD